MIQKINIYLKVLLFIVILISCSNDPNSVGSLLIPEKDAIKTKTLELFADSIESFQKDSINFGSSSTLLLGNYNNISSKVLLAFLINLPDSIKDPYTNNQANLKSAWIEIYPNYWLGDKIDISFTVHKINQSWNPLTFNFDSLSFIESSIGEDILSSLSYTEGDSVIGFTIDNNLVENWVKRSFDSSVEFNNGVLLAPTSNSSTIFGFQALTSFPLDRYTTLFLEFEKPGEFVDTVLSTPNLDIHLPLGEKTVDPNNGIVLQGGISSRGKIKISSQNIPDNIVINNALLDVYIKSTDEGTISSDTIAVSFLSDFTNSTVNKNFGRYPLVKEGNKYSGDIRQFVERWIDGEANEGLEIKLSDEIIRANAVTVYGTKDISFTPKLTLFYTTK